MRLTLPLFVGIFSVVAVSCKSRSFNSKTNKAAGGGGAPRPAITALRGKPVAFLEASKLAPTDPALRAAWGAVQYSPLTPCDLMAWAESEDANLETDPDFFGTNKTPVSKPKTKMSYQDAVVLGGQYIAFKGDGSQSPEELKSVREGWIQSLLNWGTSHDSVGEVEKTTGGDKFSAAAIEECTMYIRSIRDSSWGCMQHMAADYVAQDFGRDKISKPDDAKELIEKYPFYSFVLGAPGKEVLPDWGSDPRRYNVNTVSYRTMKALSGYLTAIGKSQELQQLAQKSATYFKTNGLADYRAGKTIPNWLGYFDGGFGGDKGKIVSYCGYDEAAGEAR